MSSDDILHSLIEAARPSVLEETLPSSASELVATYKKSAKDDLKRKWICNAKRGGFHSPEKQVPQPSYLTKQKIEDQATLIALGNATGSPKQKDLLEIELTEWCRLLIDRV